MHRDEVLFANEAFYVAFASADLAAMERLWAERDDVVCLHPGWPALCGREAVLESWARILGNPDQPAVTVHALDALAAGPGAMLVVCYETMADTVMVASNLFVSTADGPRLLSHQAGLCPDPPALPQPGRLDFDA
ncbi:MAG: nuclear transport factor 2 family protein [Pseudomonadales bacterium]